MWPWTLGAQLAFKVLASTTILSHLSLVIQTSVVSACCNVFKLAIDRCFWECDHTTGSTKGRGKKCHISFRWAAEQPVHLRLARELRAQESTLLIRIVCHYVEAANSNAMHHSCKLTQLYPDQNSKWRVLFRPHRFWIRGNQTQQTTLQRTTPLNLTLTQPVHSLNQSHTPKHTPQDDADRAAETPSSSPKIPQRR